MIDFFKKSKSNSEKSSKERVKLNKFSKISTNWNLEEIKEYIHNRNEIEKLSNIGIASILLRFIYNRKDDHHIESEQRREFEITDRLERIKKGFDIVILIANLTILDSNNIPLIREFINVYKDVIKEFDYKLSQTYKNKFKMAIKNAELNALTKSQFKQTLNIKYNR